MTTEDANKLDAIMRRIRGLLAKADSTTFPAEADSLRAKAEALMAQYRIEEITGAPVGGIDVKWTTVPVCDLRNEFRSFYTSLAATIMNHVGMRGIQKLGEDGNWVIEMVGYESDQRFFDLLFTSAQLEFGKRMEPKYDPNESDQVNAYRMRSAGMEGRRIALAIWGKDDKSLRVKARNLYRKEAEALGEDIEALSGRGNNMAGFRASYADGFLNRLYYRLFDMRTSLGEQSQGLVLAGRKDAIDNAYYDRFPHLRPSTTPSPAWKDPRDNCERCQKAKSGYCREHAYMRPSYAQPRGPRHNSAAASRGRSAADRVDLGARGRLDS